MTNVLVTGSSSGFGLLTVVELARRGDAVVATMRDLARAGGLRDALAAAGEGVAERVRLVRLDVTDEASVLEAVDGAGPLDAVVNNAGVASGAPIEETTVEALASVFDTNVYGPLRVIRAVLPGMRARGSGHVVNVTSLAAFMAPPFMGAYAASKHALDAIGESLAAEVAPFGVHVTNVAPGAYDTPMIGLVATEVDGIDAASPYGERRRAMLERHGQMMRDQPDATDVAIAIADAIHTDPPPGRVIVPAASAGLAGLRGSMSPEQLRSVLAASYGI